jgi:putative FmdB family regulatory protein
MPLYEYRCTRCGHMQESYRKLHERLVAGTCEKCGDLAVFVISPGPKPTDHLYPRMVENFEHNPVQVNSLKHYYSEQKRRGLVDGGRPRGVKGQWI